MSRRSLLCWTTRRVLAWVRGRGDGLGWRRAVSVAVRRTVVWLLTRRAVVGVLRAVVEGCCRETVAERRVVLVVSIRAWRATVVVWVAVRVVRVVTCRVRTVTGVGRPGPLPTCG